MTKERTYLIVRDYHNTFYAHLTEFALRMNGTENLTFNKGSFKRLEKSAGIDLDMH